MQIAICCRSPSSQRLRQQTWQPRWQQRPPCKHRVPELDNLGKRPYQEAEHRFGFVVRRSPATVCAVHRMVSKIRVYRIWAAESFLIGQGTGVWQLSRPVLKDETFRALLSVSNFGSGLGSEEPRRTMRGSGSISERVSEPCREPRGFGLCARVRALGPRELRGETTASRRQGTKRLLGRETGDPVFARLLCRRRGRETKVGLTIAAGKRSLPIGVQAGQGCLQPADG